MPEESAPCMCGIVGLEERCASHLFDIRDLDALKDVVAKAQPEVVFHLAAQSLVQVGIEDPLLTYSTNVLGTANVLEVLSSCVEKLPEACVVVTSDKVYARKESVNEAFREGSLLGGTEHYSASKAAAEMVASGYRRSFVVDKTSRLVTARGGNVVGGGDFSEHRLVPDIYRACNNDEPITLRMPKAIRPWQHVLDCLGSYMSYAELVASGDKVPASLNFGPEKKGISVFEVAMLMRERLGKNLQIDVVEDKKTAEHEFLQIDPSRSHKVLGWKPKLAEESIWEWTASWYREYGKGTDMAEYTQSQIKEYMNM